MSSFTKAHAAIVYDLQASGLLGRDYWRNVGAFRYYIGAEGSDEWVDVPAGILSDGATVPFPVNALIPPWGSYAQNVILHDYLCNTYQKSVLRNGQVVQVAITRKEIDSILNESMKVTNVPGYIRIAIMTGVTGYRLVMRPSQPRRNPERVRLEALYDPAKFAF